MRRGRWLVALLSLLACEAPVFFVDGKRGEDQILLLYAAARPLQRFYRVAGSEVWSRTASTSVEAPPGTGLWELPPEWTVVNLTPSTFWAADERCLPLQIPPDELAAQLEVAGVAGEKCCAPPELPGFAGLERTAEKRCTVPANSGRNPGADALPVLVWP